MATKPTSEKLIKKFFEHDPLDAAHTLETMDEEEAIAILRNLPAHLAVEAFEFIELRFAAELVMKLPQKQLKQLLVDLEVSRTADLFLRLDEEDKELFIGYLSPTKKRQVQEHLIYPESSAGRIMSPDFLAFYQGIKVKEGIQRLRSLMKKGERIDYVYVVDSENKLVGVLIMRDLLLSNPDTPLGKVMHKQVFSVNAFMDREDVAHQVAQKRFLAVPVVDRESRILGTIKTNELLTHTEEEATEDIQKMFGAGGDERVFSPMSFTISKRLPWLHVNLATAFLAAFVISFFEDIIAKVTLLAVFLPVVAGQGGNSGAQSLAVVMRGLVTKEIQPNLARRVVRKEAVTGLFNGLILGVVTGAVAWLWGGNPYLGLVIGIAMVINMLLAGLAGAAIPLTMKALGLDPAQSSSIILTTITDVVGFLAFLSLAVLFQNHLIV